MISCCFSPEVQLTYKLADDCLSIAVIEVCELCTSMAVLLLELVDTTISECPNEGKVDK